MAYFAQTLTSGPQTVTVVPTDWNRTADWIRNASKPLVATFPDATMFSANLSVTQNPGDFAGYGTNGFGTMMCWRFEKARIYVWYQDVTCNAVYDCNRQSAMGDAPNAPTPSIANDNGDSQTSNNIALGVGLGVGIPSLLVAIIGVWQAKVRGMLPGFSHSEGATSRESDTESRSGVLFEHPRGPDLTIAPTIELSEGIGDRPLQPTITA
ncbi:hypothetical protein K491DRAFT_682946 [Lophiostoma macrostomum CBS 122681]|uniref:Uncharacterized protein n=1 Tax=Lophiostoma macrostomum CBS 122681 TaxID=1314788 RepID=A0A6A6SS54_9PLEO|nr:hypothetical protein K491DRAFT_682946 [Lophiostoma macrostomum CBS 122681]